ncbi:MAG: hypothetical protein ACFFD4_19790 [Candidatus Odinarchaeota archaeon]
MKFIHGLTGKWSDMFYWIYRVIGLDTILVSVVGLGMEREDRLLAILCYPWKRIVIDNGAFTLLRNYKYSYVPEDPVSRLKLQLQLVAFSTVKRFTVIVSDFIGNPSKSTDSYMKCFEYIKDLQSKGRWDWRIDQVILTVQSPGKKNFFRSLFDVLDIASLYENETSLQVMIATPSALNETTGKLEFINGSFVETFVKLCRNRGFNTHVFGRCSDKFDLPEVIDIGHSGVDSFDTTRCHFLARKIVVLIESTDLKEIQQIMKFQYLDYYLEFIKSRNVSTPDLYYISALMVAKWGSVIEKLDLTAKEWTIVKWRNGNGI